MTEHGTDLVSDQVQAVPAPAPADDDEQRASSDDAVAPGAIVDGSQVIAHDGYDVDAWSAAARDYRRLGRLAEEAGERLRTAPALLRDLFWGFSKATPRIAPPVPLTAAHELNRQLVEQVMGTVEWRRVRAAGTIGEPLTSAMATIGAARRVLAALDDATVGQFNDLAALEAEAADLLARADLLDDLAGQAAGDRAADLFAQAAEARRQADAACQQAEAVQQQVAARAEERADTVRRAARAGLAAAEAEIDEANQALKAFGGGYGVGAGPGAGPTLSTREKIALAQQVTQNPKLQQIAALAGRLTRVALQVQSTRVSHPPDEITSITIGDDLAHVLPSELALLGDPDLEDLFWARFVERRLFVYELIGHERQGQGPVVLAIDNSGSMAGAKEVWSKAVAVALLAIAGKQRRDLAVLHFGGTPQELRLFRFARGQASPQELIACCTHFFGGGTQFEPWMLAALRLIDESAFTKADVICLSDGLVAIDPAVRAEWQRRRQERGMRTFGILIGTREGAGVLAGISDALLTLDSLEDDRQVLQTIFAV